MGQEEGDEENLMVLEKEMEKVYPQDREENEYRYIEPKWLDDMARGLTAGATRHPGETWRTIPSEEHAARAIRHLNMFLMGDRSEPHLVNASMRVMMAYATANDMRVMSRTVVNEDE